MAKSLRKISINTYLLCVRDLHKISELFLNNWNDGLKQYYQSVLGNIKKPTPNAVHANVD